MKNIRGEFIIDFGNGERTMKASFDAVEMIEAKTGKSVIELLNKAAAMSFSIGDIATVFHCGLAANKDTRMTRKEIGQAITEKGVAKYTELYATFLANFVNGGEEVDGVEQTGEAQA